MATQPGRTRARRTRATTEQSLDQLNQMVDQLLKENRALKRQLEKLAASGISAGRGRSANPIERGLTAIKRKLERAVAASSTSTRRRRAASASQTRTTRRPVSPEVAERRRQALEKARRVRAEKRAAAAAAAAGE